METLIIETEGKTLERIKAFLEEIQVSFKTKTKKEKTYNPEFVKKILATKNEKSTRVNPENIWESIM